MTQTATATKLHTEISSLGTCKGCAATYRFDGSTYRRNGLKCICSTGTLLHFTEAAGLVKSDIRWSKIAAKTTRHECDGECRSAKYDRCSCECGGQNHGINWAL